MDRRVYYALMALAGLRVSIDEYAKGKQWYLHIPLLLFGVYTFIKLLSFTMLGNMAIVALVPYSFDFMLHEFAHLFTSYLPAILTASAGSVSELMLGTGLVIGAFYFRNYFASMFCLLWFDLTCQSAGSYMADAVPRQIPLISLGGALSGQDPLHDWHFVFGQLHLLGMSGFIGNMVRFVGHLAGFFGIVFAAWIMYKMAVAASAYKTATTQPNVASEPAHIVATSNRGHTNKSIYPEPTRGRFAPRQQDPSPNIGDQSGRNGPTAPQ